MAGRSHGWGDGFEGLSCTYGDFSVLDYSISKNDFKIINDIIKKSKTDREAAIFPVYEEKGENNELNQVVDILNPAIEKMGEIFKEAEKESVKIMNAHAPKSAMDNVKPAIYNTLLFKLLGWFGGAAVNTGALKKPGEDDIVQVCGYIG